MNPDYNNIAHQYDSLSQVVFGKKQERAKKEYLDLIQPEDKILIVGGGTGSILEYISNLNRNNTIDFVDVSEKMIAKAKERTIGGIRVSFYCEEIAEFGFTNYDVIITNFFFDQFLEDEGKRILLVLKDKLNRDGLLLFSDFINPTDLQNRIIHAIMKFYFKVRIGLKVKTYPNYEKMFLPTGYSMVSSKLVSRNIITQCYKLKY